jgi:predicted nucleotidyltransferase
LFPEGSEWFCGCVFLLSLESVRNHPENLYLYCMKIKPDQIRKLAGELEMKFPGISFAYLFGSASKGTLSASSDIDIAVFLKPGEEKIVMLPEIIGISESIFPGRQIDIVILNNAGELIAMEALKGKILFIREDARDLHAEFYSLTCRLSEDRLAWMKRQLYYRGYEVQWDH